MLTEGQSPCEYEDVVRWGQRDGDGIMQDGRSSIRLPVSSIVFVSSLHDFAYKDTKSFLYPQERDLIILKKAYLTASLLLLN